MSDPPSPYHTAHEPPLAPATAKQMAVWGYKPCGDHYYTPPPGEECWACFTVGADCLLPALYHTPNGWIRPPCTGCDRPGNCSASTVVSNIAFRRAPHKPHKWILESTKRAREDEYRELERDKVWAAGKAAATAATERLPTAEREQLEGCGEDGDVIDLTLLPLPDNAPHDTDSQNSSASGSASAFSAQTSTPSSVTLTSHPRTQDAPASSIKTTESNSTSGSGSGSSTGSGSISSTSPEALESWRKTLLAMSREAQTSEHETALASLSAAKKAMCAKRNACEAELVRLDAEIAKFSDKKRELEREHKRRWSEIELQSHQLVKRLKAMGEGEEEVQYGCEGKDKGKDKGDRQGTVGRLSAMAEGMAEIMRRTKK